MPSTAPRRLAVLVEGSMDPFRNKTAMGLLRFRSEEVVCVVDPSHQGGDLEQLIGCGRGIPIVGSAMEAVALGCTHLVIGVATPGGYLPKELKPIVYEAIRNRVGLISGLHEYDPNLTSLVARHAVDYVNLRKVAPEEERVVGTGKARSTKAFRMLAVGTDANIGKTTTGLHIERHLRARRLRAAFVATGQDGILVTGRGVCIDRVIADFASGAVERLVLREAKSADLLIIEGQDSILSPPYSAVALSVLHGSCPDAMILCHAPTRTHHRHTDVPIPPLSRYRDLYQAMLAPLHPGRVVAVSLNTHGMSDRDAVRALAAAADDTGLPVADVVRQGDDGVAILCAALLKAAKRRQPRSARAR
jgi:uncharacterized NAD-dependent epimerase/dehydratase family protein